MIITMRQSLQRISLSISIVFILSLKVCVGVEIDNGIIEQPYILCSGDSMTINFYTRGPFEGNVYVKNHFQDPQCKTGRTERTDVGITVAFGNPCGLRRRRNANPVGISLEATIVVMFHPQFLTKVDKAYKIECFYMQAEKLVTNQLDVSMITTASLSKNVEMPVCNYQVLDAPLSGNPVRYAMIGDMVYHTWSCTDGSDSSAYCMTIHSCTVDDGLGEIIQLLDKDGCALDRHILQNLKYQSDMVAYRESHVFKFADKQTLYFNCQVRLELKESGFCTRSADRCVEVKKFQVLKQRRKRAVKHTEVRGHAIDFDIGAPPVGVLDIEGDLEDIKSMESNSGEGTEPVSESQREFLNRVSRGLNIRRNRVDKFCLSPFTLGFVFSLLAASLMSSLSFMTVFCWAKYRQRIETIAKLERKEARKVWRK